MLEINFLAEWQFTSVYILGRREKVMPIYDCTIYDYTYEDIRDILVNAKDEEILRGGLKNKASVATLWDWCAPRIQSLLQLMNSSGCERFDVNLLPSVKKEKEPHDSCIRLTTWNGNDLTWVLALYYEDAEIRHEIEVVQNEWYDGEGDTWGILFYEDFAILESSEDIPQTINGLIRFRQNYNDIMRSVKDLIAQHQPNPSSASENMSKDMSKDTSENISKGTERDSATEKQSYVPLTMDGLEKMFWDTVENPGTQKHSHVSESRDTSEDMQESISEDTSEGVLEGTSENTSKASMVTANDYFLREFTEKGKPFEVVINEMQGKHISDAVILDILKEFLSGGIWTER